MCKRVDRVTGPRVKVHLLLKEGEQGAPLKNEFRVTEPAPEAQEVKRGGLGKGGEGRETAAVVRTLVKAHGQRASGYVIKWRKEGKKKAN